MQTLPQSYFNQKTSRFLTMAYLKLVSLVPFCSLTWLQIYLACDENQFAKFKDLVEMRTFRSHRLDTGTSAFDYEALTTMQCLDICLRTTHCASVDIKESSLKTICRINRATKTPKRFFEDKNWSHLNMSAQDLSKVCKSISSLIPLKRPVLFNVLCQTKYPLDR